MTYSPDSAFHQIRTCCNKAVDLSVQRESGCVRLSNVSYLLTRLTSILHFFYVRRYTLAIFTFLNDSKYNKQGCTCRNEDLFHVPLCTGRFVTQRTAESFQRNSLLWLSI